MYDETVIRNLFLADRFAQKLGINIGPIGDGSAVASLRVTADMLNGAGMANGGVTFTLADYALAIAANTAGENIFLSLNLSITYVSPAREGDILQAEALVRASAGRIGSAEVTVKNQKGDIIALVQGLAYETSRHKPVV